MSFAEFRSLSSRGELLQPELADRLQHREAWLTSGPTPGAAGSVRPVAPTAEDVDLPSGLPTASAASKVTPPAKTASRRKSVCSSGASRSWLQAIVSRRVRCRAGASRVPPVSRGSRCSNRASSACGGRIRTRAAASSMASGSPSRRWQISATAGAFSLSRVNPGLTAWARSTKRRTARTGGAPPARAARGRQVEWGRPGTPAPLAVAAARGWWPAPSARPGPKQRADGGCHLHQMFEVVQHQEELFRRQKLAQSLLQRLVTLFADPSAPMMAEGTSSGSCSGASGTKKTPSGKSSSSSAATCKARRVLPTPPGPVKVSSRTSSCRSRR